MQSGFRILRKRYATAGDVATAAQSTAETLSAFAAINVAQPGIDAARQYLSSQSYAGTELVVRRIVAKVQAGESASALLAELSTRQNRDGGFGELAGHDSAPIDTAFALEALALTGTAGTTVGNAVSYLLNQQKSDGGWGDASGTNVYTTAVAVRALSYFKTSYSLGGPLQGASNFLLSQRGASDLWDEDFLSSLGLIALASTVSDVSAIDQSAQALEARQLVDGSWADDVYTTALALRALRLYASRKSGGTVGTSSGTIEGYVYDADSGMPLAGASVVPTAQAGLAVSTNSSGYFAISGLAPGDYTLQVGKTGYGSVGKVAAVVPGQSTNVGVVSLYAQGSPTTPPSTLTLYGQVLDGVGNTPVAGAAVSLVGTATSLVTDAAGKFMLADLSTLSFDLDISAGGYVSQRVTVTASAYGEVSATLMLPPQGATGATETTLHGAVTDADTAEVIGGATVEVVGQTVSATSDTGGDYQLAPIGVLDFEVRFSAPGFATRSYRVTLSGHGDFTLNAALTRVATQEDQFQIVALDTQTAALGANDTHLFEVRIANLTQSQQEGLVIGEVLDANGVKIVDVTPYAPGTQAPQSLFTFQPQEVRTLTLAWNTAQVAPGLYTMIVRAVVPGSISRAVPTGTVLAERNAFADVVQTREIAGTPNFDPPLVQAGSNTPVHLLATILNYGNVDLVGQSLSLTVLRPTTDVVLYTAQTTIDAVAVNNFVMADFGSWTPSEIGNLRVIIAPTSTQLVGKVEGTLYVGDRPAGTFVVDRSVVPTGTQTVRATVTARGVDSRLGTTDPLFFAVQQAIKRGAQYVGPNARTWHTTNRCLGCHTQTQSLFGLGASLRKGAEVDPAAAMVMYNAVAGSLQSDGGLRISHSQHTTVQTSLGLWALTQWPDQQRAFRTKYKAAQHLYNRRATSGDRVWWNSDHNSHWWATAAGPTFTTIKGMVDVLDSADNLDLSTVKDYGMHALPVSTDIGAHDIELGPDGFLYVAGNGAIRRVDPNSNAVTTMVSGLPNFCYGLAVTAGPTFYAACNNGGTLYQINPDGSRVTLRTTGSVFVDVEAAPDGSIWVTEANANRILRYVPGGTFQTIATGGLLVTPAGLTFAADGTLYIANKGGWNILKRAPDSTLSVFAEPVDFQPDWITLGPDGSLYTVHRGYSRDNNVTNNGVMRIDQDGTMEHLVASSASFDSLRSPVFVNDKLWITSTGSQPFWQLDTFALNTSSLSSFAGAISGAARYFLSVYQDGNGNNIEQAQRLIGLGEARKRITDSTLQSQVDSAISYIVNLLKARQRSDGGWNWTNDARASDALVTSFVGFGLDYTNPAPDDPVTRKIVQYLLNQQQSDKSWTSSNGVFTTKLGSTSLVIAYLPTALGRLGGLDTDVSIRLPANITLANLSTQPTEVDPNAAGGQDYRWHLEALTSSAPRTITFDLTLANLQLHEERPAASEAYLTSLNSFTNSTVRADMTIPVVRADDGLALGVSTDRPVYGADDQVLIAAPVANAGVVSASGSVAFEIYASVDNSLVATLPAVPFQSIAAGGQSTVGTQWLTGATVVGYYYVHASLYDAQGRLADEATAPFEIVASTTGSPAASLRTTTDRAVYHTTDRVLIDNLARNLTSNYAIGDTLLRVAVTGPSGQVVLAQDIALGELVPGGLTERGLTQVLSAAPQGFYRVGGTLLNGRGQVLATASAAYEVREDLGLAIAGTVAVDKPLILQGETQTCTDTVRNRGTQPVTALRVRQTLARLDQEQLVNQTEVSVDIAAGGSDTLVRSFDTRPLALGDYACALETYVSGQWKALANATFHVDPPPIRINAEMAVGKKGRLLILLDPPANNGDPSDPLGPLPPGAPLLTTQRAWLEDVLTREGWSHTIVTNATTFMHEMRSGAYSVYALLSETVKLDEQFQHEFREAIYRGEGLIEAGAHDQRNQTVDEALGVKYVGKHAQATAVDFLVSELSSGGHADYPVSDKTLKIVLNGAQSRGTVNLLGQPDPVLTAYSFGSGKSVFAGFDLLIHSTKTGDSSLFTGLLKAAPLYVEPPLDPLKASRVVPVTLALTNDGIATPGRVVFTLLAGGIIEDAGPAEITGENELTWSYSLDVAGTQTITFWMRLPDSAGTTAVHASIQVGSVDTGYTEHRTVDLALTASMPAGLTEALNLSAGDFDLRLVNKYLNDAKTALAARDYPGAMKALVQAADELAKSTNARAPAIRRMVGQAMYEVGRKL